MRTVNWALNAAPITIAKTVVNPYFYWDSYSRREPTFSATQNSIWVPNLDRSEAL